MILARELAVGLSDLLLRSPLRYPENLVQVLGLHTLNLFRNYNLRRSYRLSSQEVSSLERLEDRAFLVLFGGLSHDGFVDVRVEGLAVGGDGQEALLTEHVCELVAGYPHALADIAPGLEGAVQVEIGRAHV